MIIRKRPHRPTGNLRGRPPSLPCDLEFQILAYYQKRIDPKTGLVKTAWKELKKELGVGRTTIAKSIARLKEKGYIQNVDSSTREKYKVNKFDCFYRLNIPNSEKLTS